jgi:hypothetical protein
MTLLALPPSGAEVSATTAQALAEGASSHPGFEWPQSGPLPDGSTSFGDTSDGDSAAYQPMTSPVKEEFDWSIPKVRREFILLEQKFLAGKATSAERIRYGDMRVSRNSEIFADRALRDYAEVQRLKKLSDKLAEIQKYLRPIHF